MAGAHARPAHGGYPARREAAPRVDVTQQRTINFLEFAFRNIDLPPLSERDLDDIRQGLQDLASDVARDALTVSA